MIRSPSASLRWHVLSRDAFTCRYCGRKPEPGNGVILQVDHVHPHSRGGATTVDNLVTACGDCNSGKSAKLLPVPGAAVRRPAKPKSVSKPVSEWRLPRAEKVRTPDEAGYWSCPTRFQIACSAYQLGETFNWVRKLLAGQGVDVPPPARGDREWPQTVTEHELRGRNHIYNDMLFGPRGGFDPLFTPPLLIMSDLEIGPASPAPGAP